MQEESANQIGMSQLNKSPLSRILNVVWAGLLALVLTIVTGAVWTVLVVINLRISPTIPWAVAAMALLLWLMFGYLGGRWWPRSTSETRRNYLRANRMSRRVWFWALSAGSLSIVALTGLWPILVRIMKIQPHSLPDFSRYPLRTVVLMIVMGALATSTAEEAGFRGYFQRTLEARVGGPFAIIIAMVVISPAHGLTQGFRWSTLLFYGVVDTMFGLMAYLTNSILPGIVVHTVGLVIFFTVIWPYDAERQSLTDNGADVWLWIHVAQVILFTALSVIAFRQLCQRTRVVRL